jgi:hypothetical protein
MTRSIMVSAAIITLAAIRLATSAWGQEGPTDADLKAGYCFSVTQDNFSGLMKQTCQRDASDPPELAKIKEKTCQDSQAAVQRLRDYLTARGYLLGTRDPTPIAIAGNRGHADWKECYQDIFVNPTPEESACRSPCMNSRDPSSCMQACPQPASCARVRSCYDLSYLPF